MKEGPEARRRRRWATQPALRPQGKELARTAVPPAGVLSPSAQSGFTTHGGQRGVPVFLGRRSV